MRRGVAFVLLGSLVACTPAMREPAPPAAQRDIAHEADLARGGRLYDKWWAELGVAAPTDAHPAYPTDAEFASRPDATWRCKECHGWDYIGKDGAYAGGKHATGIAGILGAAGGDAAEIAATLRDETHGYGEFLSDEDLRQAALFVASGAFDMDAVIDRESKAARGDAARGAVHYTNLCATCHGADGVAEDMPVLGTVSRDNPWESLHKIQNGQPGTSMPALRSVDPQVAVDILAHTQTLRGE